MKDKIKSTQNFSKMRGESLYELGSQKLWGKIGAILILSVIFLFIYYSFYVNAALWKPLIGDISASVIGSMLAPICYFVLSLLRPDLWGRIRETLTALVTDEDIRSAIDLSDVENRFQNSVDHIREIFIQIGDLNRLEDQLGIVKQIRGQRHIWDYHIHLNHGDGHYGFLDWFFDKDDSGNLTLKADVQTTQLWCVDSKEYMRAAERVLRATKRIDRNFDGILIKALYRGEPQFKGLNELLKEDTLEIELISFVYELRGKGDIWRKPRLSVAPQKLMQAATSRMTPNAIVQVGDVPGSDVEKMAITAARKIIVQCQRSPELDVAHSSGES